MFKILIPTDFSETANNAFRFAIHFADRLDAELNVVHIYEPPEVKTMTLPHTMEEVYQSLELETFENFKDYIPQLRDIAEEEGVEDLKMSHLLLKGDVKTKILDTVKKEDIDLVIMGTQGAGMIKQIFFGNQTTYMMEHSTVPVLAIPPNIKPSKRLSNIAFATGYSKQDYAAMHWLVEWTEKLDIDLHSIHIDLGHIDDMNNLSEEWEAEFKPHDVKCYVEDANDFLYGLDTFRVKHKIDVLAMVTHSRNFINEIFNKNLAKEVVYSKTTAVFAIPEVIFEDNEEEES